ncbi:hypothetical protein [uncultured Ruegeria sp.]|uniref:hypothetical protein n=1 Tax=uncultured Ruegeria sp. TaxID=259304 RepID=UPI002615BC42|nr:hypothetical protein [uncultured Ruegeria sp.]
MTLDTTTSVIARVIQNATAAALINIACMLAWIGWDPVRSHPHGAFRFEVFGLIFFVLFGPGAFSLLASAARYAKKRSSPTLLQVTALISAVWVGFMSAALEGISV